MKIGMHAPGLLFSHYGVVGPIVAILVAVSLYLATHCSKTVGEWLVSLWAIGPPTWFLLELSWARRTLKEQPERLATLKEDQKMAAKIWAGVVAALSVLYLK